jgi:hypothetical protein
MTNLNRLMASKRASQFGREDQTALRIRNKPLYRLSIWNFIGTSGAALEEHISLMSSY